MSTLDLGTPRTADRSTTDVDARLTLRLRGRQLDRGPDGGAPLPLLALGALAAAQSLVVLDLDVPVLRPAAALVTMLVLPAWVVHRRAGLPADTAVTRAAYACGAALLGLLLIGLAVNTVLPLVGVDRPLAPRVLGAAWLLVDAALLCWRRRVPLLTVDARTLVRRAWDARVEAAQALAVAAALLAVVGAVRLNNGAGGGVALAALLLVVAAFATLWLRAGTLGRDARVLYLVSTALLLATSLRGWGVTGHDVQAEFYVFGLTAGAQHWSMDLLENAYTACLSVTLLPAVLTEATGLPGVLVFKLLVQLVFASVPVVLYLVWRRFVSRRLALVAVALVVAFPTFHNDMPYLVRQEVAFVFLALLLLAATEPRTGPWTRHALVGACGLGVVLSHYSTTYLLLLGLFGGLVALTVLRVVRRVVADPGARAGRGPVLTLLSPATVLLVLLPSVLWTGPATGTGGHPLQVAQEAVASLLDRGDSGPGSSDTTFALLGGASATDRERLDLFVGETMEVREAYPRRLALVKDPRPVDTSPEVLETDEAPLTTVGRWVEATGVDAGSVAGAARFAAAGLLQLLLLVGVGWLTWALWRSWRGRPAAYEPGADAQPGAVTPELLCLAVGVLGSVGLVVVVPSLSVEYGVLRAFLQAMLVLAPVAAVGLWWVLRRLGRAGTGWLLAVPVVLVLVLTSAGPAILGGGPAKLSLHNAGLYHDRYIVADSDVVAARRLAEAPDDSGDMVKVLTSRHQAIRVATAGVPPTEVHDRTFPTLLSVGSYVFADAGMVTRRQETVFYSGDRITYRYPLGNLDRLLDLVYSAGDSRVYR